MAMRTAYGPEIIEISGALRGESASGLAYKFFAGTMTVWLPKSECEWDETSKTMQMPVWLATEKGLV